MCHMPVQGKISRVFIVFLVGIFFFYGEGKANERSGHLMVSDYRRPRHRATPEELQVPGVYLQWKIIKET